MKLNELDLNKLHVFRVVAESSSMREAGAALLRTPSAISQSVSGLEQGLGVALFDRVGTKLRLTDAGIALLRQVQSSEDSLRGVLERLRAAPQGVSGKVALGLPLGYPAVSLSEPLSAALLAHPGLQLRLRFLNHAEQAEALLAGQVDMALSLQPLSARTKRIRSARIREEQLVLAIPAKLAYLRKGVPEGLPIVDYFQRPLQVEGWLGHHGLKKASFQVRAYGATLEHVLQFVLKGVGCAVVPRHAVESELASGAIVEHPLDKRRPWLVGAWLNSTRAPERLPAASRHVWETLGSA
jgi:DNA-binding transcriptional LysR family regulator